MVKKSEPSAPPMYPNLDQHLEDSTKDEGETLRLKRISDIREFLEKELETRGRYRRRYKSAYNTAIYLRGVEWVHGLFLFPLVLGKMKLPHAKLCLFCVV